MANEKLKGIVWIVLSALGYALMPSLSVLAYQKGYSVSQVLFYRFMISAVLLWAMIFMMKIPYKTDLKHFLYLMGIGFVGYTLCSKALFEGYRLVSGSVATMILFTHPAFVVLGEALIIRKKPSRNKIFAVIIAMLGVALIVWEKNPTYNAYGILLCFISSITYAVYCLGLSNAQTRKMHTLTVAAYVITLSAFYNLLECLFRQEPIWINEPNGVTLLIVLAVLGTVMPAIAFFSGLKIVGSGAATIISTVEPVFVFALEIIIFSSSIVFKNILGGLIVGIAIILLDRER